MRDCDFLILHVGKPFLVRILGPGFVVKKTAQNAEIGRTMVNLPPGKWMQAYLALLPKSDFWHLAEGAKWCEKNNDAFLNLANKLTNVK